MCNDLIPCLLQSGYRLPGGGSEKLGIQSIAESASVLMR